MRRVLLFTMISLLFLAVSAGAMDSIMGTVVSLERNSGTIIIQQAGTPKKITIVISPGQLPGFVEIGTTIRAWGNYSKDDPLKLHASKITRAPSPGSREDPTGVRSRLHRGR